MNNLNLQDKYLDRIADALEKQMQVDPKLVGGNVLKPNIYRIADALDPEPVLLKDGIVKNPLARIADAIESGKLKSDIPVISTSEYKSMQYEDFIKYEKFLVSDNTSGFKQGILYDGTKALPVVDLVVKCIQEGTVDEDYSVSGTNANVVIEVDKVLFKPQQLNSGNLNFHKPVKLHDTISLQYDIVAEGKLAGFGLKIGSTIGGDDILQKSLIPNGNLYANTIMTDVDVSSITGVEAYISVYNTVASNNRGMLYLTSLIV